jgi:hypothetical protein
LWFVCHTKAWTCPIFSFQPFRPHWLTGRERSRETKPDGNAVRPKIGCSWDFAAALRQAVTELGFWFLRCPTNNNSKPPIWELFIPPTKMVIFLGDGGFMALFYPHGDGSNISHL